MAALSFTAQFPYPGPQHDRQKLMRASLASSCLRGEMRVWQFMAGVRGAELRRRPHEWRKPLLQSGVFHRVAREPWLCGDELVRPMSSRRSGTDYLVLGDALRAGHTEMAEWCMGDELPAFQHGMFHERPTGRSWLKAPLPTLMHSACEIGWDWGRRRIEQLVAESDDPVAVGMRESGEYAGVLAVACARAGSWNSLQWAKAFAADAGEERVLSLVAETSTARHVAGTLTLGVAEWLWRSYSGDVSTLAEHAAFNGNWSVMEWLVRSGSINAATCQCFACAARHDSVAAMRFLRDHGLDSNYENAARWAARTGSVCVLEWLWSEKPECITRQCVAEAAGSGDVGKVRFLLGRCGLEALHARFPDVIAQDRKGICLQSAAAAGREDVVEFILRHVEATECTERTLENACAANNLELVQLLHGRFPDVALSSMAMRLSCCDGALEVAEWLHKEQGLAPDTESAVRAGHLLMLEYFVQHCGISGPLDQAVLIDAVYSNCLHVVGYLVRRGMVDITDSLLQEVQEEGVGWPMQRFLRRHVAP